MGNQHWYDAVVYVFPTEQLKSKYVRKFQKKTWPLYEYDAANRCYIRLQEPWKVPQNINQVFRFEVAQLL